LTGAFEIIVSVAMPKIAVGMVRWDVAARREEQMHLSQGTCERSGRIIHQKAVKGLSESTRLPALR